MTRVIALTALTAPGLSEAPVHEPVHGRRQAISVAVTQRSGLGLPQYSDGPSDDLARGDPGRGPPCTAELSRIWNQAAAFRRRADRTRARRAAWGPSRRDAAGRARGPDSWTSARCGSLSDAPITLSIRLRPRSLAIPAIHVG